MRIVDTDVDVSLTNSIYYIDHIKNKSMFDQVPSALAEAPTVYTVGDGEETADIEGFYLLLRYL